MQFNTNGFIRLNYLHVGRISLTVVLIRVTITECIKMASKFKHMFTTWNTGIYIHCLEENVYKQYIKLEVSNKIISYQKEPKKIQSNIKVQERIKHQGPRINDLLVENFVPNNIILNNESTYLVKHLVAVSVP